MAKKLGGIAMELERSYINDIVPGNICKIQGYIDSLRNKKNIAFIVLKDISGKVQIVVEKDKLPEIAEEVDKLTIDSVVTIVGTVVENTYVKLRGIEVIPTQIIIESIAAPLPIHRQGSKGKDISSIDHRIDYRWIELRTEQNQLIFKVQTFMVQVLREYLTERNFIEMHSPKLIGAASESGSDVFELKYFDRKAYLSQSPQFYKQMAMAAGFEKIFEVGPVFRAEKSHTSRHATEFTGFDIEFSYIVSHKDVMVLEENMLTFMLNKIAKKYGTDIKELFGVDIAVPTMPFPVIALSELYKILEERYGYTVEDTEKGDLTTEAEKLSYQYVKEEFGHEFLFVTDFDSKKRAFYHMRENGVPKGYDLIWKGVEITTGAQREHRYEILRQQADENGLTKDVEFYLEFFKYGCPPHGGFGLGVDRLTMLLLGIGIKEAMFLFRGPDRLTP